MQVLSFDVAIVGGGLVGATLALALARSTTLRVALLEADVNEASWTADNYHPRVSAITLASQRILQALDVWEEIIAKRSSLFSGIQIWDDASKKTMQFKAADIAEAALGFIIENNAIQQSLNEKIHHTQIKKILPIKLQQLVQCDDHVELIALDKKITAKLVVGADGANSWVRKQLQIKVHEKNYQESGLVTSVQTTLPHEKIARQVFLETGPLAFLPLAKANLCSIVWSLPTEIAENMMQLQDDAFSTKLYAAFPHLGSILKVEKRFIFPLKKQQTDCYAKGRVALVGDAAHIVHPLAGQGVNIGMLDAVSLAEIILEAEQKNRDIALSLYLRKYERWRKADNFAMLTGINALHAAFSIKQKPWQSLRSLGFDLTNYSSWLKNYFVLQAVGNRSGLPKLGSVLSSKVNRKYLFS